MKIPAWVWIIASAGLLWLVWRQSQGAPLLPFISPDTGSTPAPSPSEVLAVNAPATSTYTLIANFEKFSATPYRDANGWSIGYGHFMGATATMNNITQDDAWNLLVNDVSNAAQAVSTAVQTPLTQNQYDALVSLAYNIGNTAFANSTLVKQLNAGNTQAAADQFPRWNQSQGQVLAALVDRRAQERQLFLT
jgi:lysozyme